MTKKLSIIIVTYDSSNIILDCIKKIDYKKHEVYVVDNNSSDNTVELVKNNYPEVNIIKSKNNIGYGRGNNLALSEVKTEYSLILNPDSFIDDKYVDEILLEMDNDSSVSIAAPTLLKEYPENNDSIQEQIKVIEGNLIEKKDNKYFVKYIIGAIVFLRMSFFKDIGFYDEETFMFYEDDEICYRAIKNNGNCVIFEKKYGFHIGGGSTNPRFCITYKRNLHLYLSKMRWKQKRKGYFSAFKSSIRLLLLNLLLASFNIFFNRIKFAQNLGFCSGLLLFLMNKKPFKKDGTPR